MIFFKWLAILTFAQSLVFFCYLMYILWKDYKSNKPEALKDFNVWEL